MSDHDMSDQDVTDRELEPNDDDLKELLAKRQHARPNKVTWVLLVLLVLALGFAMGACVQKGVTAATSAAASAASPPPIATDPTGSIGGPPSARRGDLEIGTIESVDGTTLTITTPAGEAITIEVPEGTSVTSSVEVPLGDLPVGSNVIIRGTREDDGTFTADSVTESAADFPRGDMRPAPAQ